MKSRSADEALAALKHGNERFREERVKGAGRDASRRRELAAGQSPFAIILTCSDSRVAPELVFDTGLGELFLARVAGNVANTSSIASIEYAVAHLGSKLIVVMAHESCGAVAAAIEGGDAGKNLNHLLGHIQPALAESVEREVNVVARCNARLNARRLTSESTILRSAVETDGVKIVTAYYNLGSGVVEFD
jgi:carbonic anhydrase